METFSASLAICAGNSPVSGEFPAQRPVTRSFDVLFDLRLNKPLSKQWWGWWFETLSRPSWRHCNAYRNRGQNGLSMVLDNHNNTQQIASYAHDSHIVHFPAQFSIVIQFYFPYEILQLASSCQRKPMNSI